MNNGNPNPPAQGQPPNGQPQPQRQHIFRPEHIRNLPDYFSNEDKTKWEGALRSLWGQMNSNPPDSTSHMEAKKMLFDFSRNLTSKLALFRAQQASTMHAQRPQPLTQAPQQIPQQMPQAMQHTQPENSQNMHKPMAPIPQQQTVPKYPAKIVEHVESFPYSFPPQYTPDSQEAQQWLKTVKQRYMSGLGTMENAKNRVQQLKALEKKRSDEGKPLTPEEAKEFAEKINQAQKAHAEASSWIEKFRASQATQKQNASGQPGDNAPQNQQAPTRPQINPQQNIPSLQSTQTVNAAIEAARNQHMGGGRPHLGNAAIGAQGGQNQVTKQEDGAPAPINTALQQTQRAGQTNNSPQTGQQQTQVQSAGPPQEPKPLSHQAALQTAARTYSSGQTSGTPNVMGHSHPQAPVMPRDASMSLNPKMPIAKQLPDRATALPLPVAMPPNRPTYSGGPVGATNGSMNAAVISKPPGFYLGADGGAVLNKRKLDELVRQVTGGGEGLDSGEGLTAEVEESILNVADNFVDQVLQSACKAAKERGSQVLEIRDIQLTLERGYNIRIPGYASDEIRTVRKVQPTNAWISKMSAVQAAKVTGGKGTE